MVSQIVWARRKTQTRRIMRMQPYTRAWGFGFPTRRGGFVSLAMIPADCPYGQRGDRLWMRENFTFVNVDRERNIVCIAYDADGEHLPTRVDIQVTPEQLADFMGDEREKIDPFHRRRYPAMFMNRWMSRVLLENEEIRVQQLQDITEEDAIAEGVMPVLDGSGQMKWRGSWETETRIRAVDAYRDLWELIHGDGSWGRNPWVWAVTFKEIWRWA